MKLVAYVTFVLKSYQRCGLDATKALIRNWLLLVGSVAAVVAFVVANQFFSGFGIGGAFLLGFVQIVLLTYYYGWVADSVQKERLRPSTMLQLDYPLFFHVISVAFLLWIARMIVNAVAQSAGAPWIMDLLQLGIVVIFNAIPETLYIHRYEGLHALSHSAEFTRENWIEWFLPFVVILLPLLLVSPEYVLALLANSEELLPASVVVTSWINAGQFSSWPLGILGLIVASWFMLFRGFLFQELESGSLRQRMFRSGSR